ncbi:hypothetical protein AAF712_015153 [Marasmius tenuissimus]|uniref:Uncharacterized protein n=1 Tax=Marasmius tenuissimus TaxID=585030 RepID=A0ABR2Z932_9AGAR
MEPLVDPDNPVYEDSQGPPSTPSQPAQGRGTGPSDGSPLFPSSSEPGGDLLGGSSASISLAQTTSVNTTPLLSFSSQSASSQSSTPSTPSPKPRLRFARTYLDGKRQHASWDNPLFGMMKAKKGSVKYDVLRTGSLLGRVERKEMNKRFVRGSDRILLSCEKLTDETGCWLYIGANHPSVHGEYVHWTLPVMEQDLPPDTRDRFDQTTCSLFTALKMACRQSIVNVQLEASQYHTQLEAAKTEGAKKQALIDRLIEFVQSRGADVNAMLKT